MEKERIAAIDGLRAIAALGVIWIHTWTYNNNLSLYIGKIDLFRLVAILGNGVDLFFVISGFCMYLVFDKVNLNLYSYATFIKKRWFRIAPLFYTSALVYALLGLYSDNTYPILKLLCINYLFLGNTYFGSNIIGPYWSLNTEWHFYLLLPLVFFKYPKYFTIKLTTLILLSLVSWGLISNGILNGDYWKPQIIPRFIEFGWGIFAGYYFKLGCKFSKFYINWGLCIFSIIAYIGRVFMTEDILNIFPSIGWVLNAISVPMMTMGFALIMYHTITEKSLLSDLLSSKYMQYLGRISYSLYIWHSLILVLYNYVIPSYHGTVITCITSYIIITILTIIISHFSYIFIELHFAGNKKPIPELINA